jgi:hypothetical protein
LALREVYLLSRLFALQMAAVLAFLLPVVEISLAVREGLAARVMAAAMAAQAVLAKAPISLVAGVAVQVDMRGMAAVQAAYLGQRDVTVLRVLAAQGAAAGCDASFRLLLCLFSCLANCPVWTVERERESGCTSPNPR